jgi:hypothetical protein
VVYALVIPKTELILLCAIPLPRAAAAAFVEEDVTKG